MALSESPKPYKYNGLTEPDSFRLILLQPVSSREDDLRCTLLHSTLSQCDRDIIDHYTALSYVWGHPSQTDFIFIDELRVTITASLAAALRDLRDPSRVLRIWADALCIDQSNLDERGSQVGLMAQIYQTAHHTVIHFGPLTEDAETVLMAVPSNTASISRRPNQTSGLIRAAKDGILKRVWFTRVWIFQELVLSRDPWVQCGSLRARWTDLCDILLRPNEKAIREPYKQYFQVLADMNSSRGVFGQKLMFHLSARRGFGATDPRDMIFAHIGISSDAQALRQYVAVDYTRDCAAVYEDTARYLFKNIGPEGPQLFFPHAARSSKSRFDSLASWAPDWSIPSANLQTMYRVNNTRRGLLSPELHYAFVGQPVVLAYIGYEADVIEDFSMVLPDPDEIDQSIKARYRISANQLRVIYESNVWWSGDEDGQHRHINFRGKEQEHERLSRELAKEWLSFLSTSILTWHKDLAENRFQRMSDLSPSSCLGWSTGQLRA